MKELAAPIRRDLEILEKKLCSFLETGDELQDKISAHIFRSGGKRVRPALFLTCAKVLAWENENRFAVAAALEYIHTASLLHDDVIDSADKRRGKPTVNATWDNTIAVLSGDRVHATASRLLICARSFELFDRVCEAVQKMSESEIFQLTILWNETTSHSEYNRVVNGKTAVLFEVCSLAAAQILNLPEHVIKEFGSYGRNLGFAFQIIDDCLDFDGSEKTVGKPLLSDLLEGKITLPLICALKESKTKNGKNNLESLVSEICKSKFASAEQLTQVQTLVHTTGGLAKAREAAKDYAFSAIKNMENALKEVTISNSEAANALLRVPHLLLERNS